MTSCRSIFCSVEARIAFSCVYLVCGLIAGFAFGGYYRNYNAAGFGFAVALFSIPTLIMHVKYKRATLGPLVRDRPALLPVLMGIGCVGQLTSVAGMIAYIALGVTKRQSFHHDYSENYWVALVWPWMLWKCSFMLFWFARKYRRELAAPATVVVKDEVVEVVVEDNKEAIRVQQENAGKQNSEKNIA